jgi:hypothetical protein
MILNKLAQQMMSKRKMFDPSNKEHLREFKYFCEEHKWRNSCPFWLEWPYFSVPDMIKDKIINNIISKNI